MATPIIVDIPHELGRAEARRRIESGFAGMIRRFPGTVGNYSQRWDGDRLTFELVSMGQTVGGVIDVLDDVVKMRIELPGVLGLIAGRFRGQLARAGQSLLTKR